MQFLYFHLFSNLYFYFGNLFVYDRKIIEFPSYAFLTVSKAIFYSKYLLIKVFLASRFSRAPHLGHLQKEILKNFTEPNMHLTFITVHVMSVVRWLPKIFILSGLPARKYYM